MQSSYKWGRAQIGLILMVIFIEWCSWLPVNSIDKTGVIISAPVSRSVLLLSYVFGLQNHLSKYFSEAPSLPCMWLRSFPAHRFTTVHEASCFLVSLNQRMAGSQVYPSQLQFKVLESLFLFLFSRTWLFSSTSYSCAFTYLNLQLLISIGQM